MTRTIAPRTARAAANPPPTGLPGPPRAVPSTLPALLDIPARVNAVLGEVLDQQRAALRGVDDALAPVAEAAGALVLEGGKRLRPAFVYWGWRGAGALDADPPIVAGAALELLHAFALAHDDVMDGDDLRRGRPTLHAHFAARHRASGRPGDAAAYGRSAAIVVGDLLTVWADRLLADDRLPEASGPAVRRLYDTMRTEVIAGQYLDITSELPTVEQALRIARYKSAVYTVARPLQIGGTLADAPGTLDDLYWDLGIAVGEGFQLRDDLLDVYGDPAETGRPAGGDLRQGRPTVLLALALERATPSRHEVLRASVGDRELDDTGLARLAEVIAETGAPAIVERLIADRLHTALALLDDAAIDPTAREPLSALVTAALERTR